MTELNSPSRDLSQTGLHKLYETAVEPFDAGDLGQAEQCLKESIDQEPPHGQADWYLARVKEQRGQFDEALFFWKTCALLNDGSLDWVDGVYAKLADYYTRNGRLEEWYRFLSQAPRPKPECVNIQRFLAMAADRKGPTMAGAITTLKVQQRNKQRVNVYLDGRYAFSLALTEAAKLRRGQHLSDEDIEDLLGRDLVEKAHSRALDFLSYRPRSRAEVERHLRTKNIPAGVTAEVVERLSGVGLLDDMAFARYWVDNRDRFNPRSSHLLRHELHQKGVDDEVIDQALAEVDEDENANRLATQRARRLTHLDEQAFRRKLSAYLARRGFPYDVVRPAVERAWRELQARDTTD